MKTRTLLSLCLLVSLLDSAEAGRIRLTQPKTRYTHPREEKWGPSSPGGSVGGWEPGSTKRPPTGKAGWQNVPSNTWKAPRDAAAERERERRRLRRQGGLLR